MSPIKAPWERYELAWPLFFSGFDDRRQVRNSSYSEWKWATSPPFHLFSHQLFFRVNTWMINFRITISNNLKFQLFSYSHFYELYSSSSNIIHVWERIFDSKIIQPIHNVELWKHAKSSRIRTRNQNPTDPHVISILWQPYAYQWDYLCLDKRGTVGMSNSRQSLRRQQGQHECGRSRLRIHNIRITSAGAGLRGWVSSTPYIEESNC